MAYTVQQLSDLAGVSVRTLHYYDQVGLLKPAGLKNNGYRYYEEPQLLKLQQILFFRELEFPLTEIGKILSAPSFDMEKALEDQRHLIELKRKRLGGLIKTIDKTIQKIKKGNGMDDKELYGSFSKEEVDSYSKEAKERWGNTDAWKQSQERVKKMGKAGLKKVMEENGKILLEIAAAMKLAPDSADVQRLIAKHYNGLRAFYEPNLEMYRGLAEMYVVDPRFKSFYEKVAPGLAQFMRDAMVAYCDIQEKSK